ncbi:amino acid adenylation domain-containing protein [Thalassobaculum sp.]|uniref:amino acid adenylation domain-containing protein n=1 Tax=Thalassobaculum sp. TaxID=2022740 RepID=UPI0032EABFAD
MNDQTVQMTPLQKAAVALKAQRARIAELEQAASAPIAVVGMGCRYAAGGDDPDALWRALEDGRDGSREVPRDRWDLDAVYDPTPGVPGKMYVRKSCFIDGVDRFDPLFFRISPREAVGIDPQQRLLLEVAWEALEDASIPPPSLVGSRTGVFLGISTNDYSALLSRTAHGSGSNATAGAGNAASVASGRLSYSFGLQGPCMAVDTACSSSLVATHLAVKALRNRECGLALVAGVNLMLAPDITINFCQGRMLSPDGACKTFDADADGYVRGEGCGVVVLKRLSDALADGDRVLSVIRGSAVNQDGRSAGLTAPNGLAQEAVIRQALADARLEPGAVDAIEAHGTGTALGDPIEMHALKAVYGDRDRPLYVGSIKTNIGHTEAAAGVAGIIKAVMMLRRQAVPPSLHFTRLNPHIDLGGADFRVPTGRLETRLERVGVSSFGFSGTNVHVVLEALPRPVELPSGTEPAAANTTAPRLLISARTPEALAALTARYRRFLAETDEDFADICHTAAVGRARLPWWICVERPEDLANATPSNDPHPVLPETHGRRVALPAYAFENTRYWVDSAPGPAPEPQPAPEPEPDAPAGTHPLLGRRLSLPLSTEARWEATVDTRRPGLGFLADHVVDGVPVMPAAAFAEIALAARPGHDLVDLRLPAPLRLPDGTSRHLQTIVGADGALRIVGFQPDSDAATVHATGRLEPAVAPQFAPTPEPGTTIAPEAVYAAMERLGVRHGPAFRLLRSVRHGEGVATGVIDALAPGSFGVHPVALDAALTLVAAALPEVDDALLVPSRVGRVSLIRPPSGPLTATAIAARRGDRVTARVTLGDADGVCLLVSDLVFERAAPPRASGLYEPVWAEAAADAGGPPAFFPALGDLVAALTADGERLAEANGMEAYAEAGEALERVATQYVLVALRHRGLPLEAGRQFGFGALAESLGIAERHHRLFRRMLEMLRQDGILEAHGRRWTVLEAPPEADPEPAAAAVEARFPQMAGEIAVLRRCGAALAGVLAGEVDPLTLLFPADDAGAGAFYADSGYARTVNGLLQSAAAALAGATPAGRPLRVLEVGAGTGGATGAVLDGLGDTPRAYTFTDLSAGFLSAARDRFGAEAIATRILDIEADPADQGFAAGEADIVLAANVLHATRDIGRSLAHIRGLLAPGGVLMLVESSSPRRWVDIIFGLTEGWWRFEDSDRRPDHPLLSPDGWQAALAEAGFEPGPVAGSDVILARRPPEPMAATGAGIGSWALTGDPGQCGDLGEALAAAGETIAYPSLADHRVHVVPPAATDEAAQTALLRDLVALAREAADSAVPQRLTLVASGAPGHAGLSGFVRTLAMEEPALAPRLLLDPPDAATLAGELLADRSDDEVRWIDGRRRVLRIAPAAAPRGPAKIGGTWLITGGFGGLGLAVARWLAVQGAGRIALLGRNPPETVADLGIPVDVHQGDAADAELIDRILDGLGDVEGVIHAAGSLANAPVAAQSEGTIARVLHAKIGGAVALDRATRALAGRGRPVRHFVLFASAAGVLGSARQSNHAFASSFLDGLAHARRADGLPALSLDWGVWREIGAAARMGFDEQADQLGLGSIVPADGLAALGSALAASQAQLLVLPSVDWPAFLANFEGALPSLYAEVAAAPVPPQPVAAAVTVPSPPTAAAPAAGAVDRVAGIVSDILGLAGQHVDRRAPLHELGLDSLVAVEIKNRVEKELGIPVSVRDLIEGASIEAIAGNAPAGPDDGHARFKEIRDRVEAIVAQILGLTGTVDVRAPLYEMGLDSLVAVEIKNRVEKELGAPLSVRDLIEGASIESIAETVAGGGTADADPPVAGAARVILPDPANRHAPFPLTEMQQAYWLGRRSDVELGNVGCYLYTEFDTSVVDVERAEQAFNALIRRHDMLRAVIGPDGLQRVLPEVPYYRFEVLDLRGQSADEALDRLRRELPQRLVDPDVWPLFDVRVTVLDDRVRLHTGFDLIALDAASIFALRREWGRLYDDPETVLPEIGLSFRDYVLEEQAYRDTAAWKASEAYWRERAATLPGGPDLPLARDPATRDRPSFERHRVVVPKAAAEALKRQAQSRNLTLSTLLAAAYADTLAAWSRSAHFSLTVTSFNRPQHHPDIGALLGDFTSTFLLEVDARAPRFQDRAARLARRLSEDLEHSSVGGVHVLREMNRRSGGEPGRGIRYVPVVFTSALGFRRPGSLDAEETDATGWDRLGTTVYNVSSTPQVWIDHQISEEDGNLLCNWDTVVGLFPDGMVEAMVEAYGRLLHDLAEGDGWDRPVRDALPAAPRAAFRPVDADGLLHQAFEEQAAREPDRVAVIAPDRALTYGQLDSAATHLAFSISEQLCGAEAARDRLVAVCFPKGWRQIVACLAVLKAGAAYLPIDPSLPAERRRLLIEQGEALVLDYDDDVDDALGAARRGEPLPGLAPIEGADRLAYVIYTSGSTGQPKGVMIDHRAALATVREVNRRWKVGPDDRAIGLSALNFDLSVYDIFGPLSVGGALVLPDPAASRDPERWARLLVEHRVTLWNTVPALMAMQVEHGLPAGHALRLVMMSGDWVPLDLIPRLRGQAPDARLVALGGATEAAIWSNAHEIGEPDPDWPSVPYGTPLDGHMLHVVNDRGEPCPDWVVGEIEISGQGLARGYWRDPVRTDERFRVDPATGERRYRTGDLGRFRPHAGSPPDAPTPIEFLGREDFQVKIQGHRIELGEIEATLATHPEVAQAVAVTATEGGRARSLHAFVVPEGGGTMEAADYRAVAAAAQAAAEATAVAISADDYAALSDRLSDNAAAAAAAALRRLAGPDALPSAEALVADHGVAARYRAWLARMLPEVARVGWDAEPLPFESVDSVNRLGFGSEALGLLDMVTGSLADILTERRHSSSIYLSAATPAVYETLFAGPNATIAAAVTALAAERPITVLEVGGGLGTTLEAIAPALPDGRVRYRFTDVSRHMVNRARERFGDRRWVAFDVLDFDREPEGTPDAFDVVIASSALHAAADVRRTLAILRRHLKPGGLLVLSEQTRFFPWFDLNMGLQAGFDTRTDRDLRPDHPLLDRDTWVALLADTGLDAVAVPRAEGSLTDRMGLDVILAAAPAVPEVADGFEERLRAHLADRLPAYMVPQSLTAIDRLPLSANGKVDRGALRRLVGTQPQPDGGAGPLDALEATVAEVVAELLQRDDCPPDRSLFELGATSLTMVALQRRLSERLGRTVPLQAIFEEPTARSLARAIADGRAGTHAMVVLEPRPDDTRPRLFMMPGIMSLPFYLRGMAAALADDVALVSAQLPGLLGDERPIDSIEAQADYALDAIRRIQPHGPYLVGGHSFGGCVAIEVARRLRDAGEAVPLLLLGDTVRTRTDLAAFQTDAVAHEALARALYALYGDALPGSYEDLARFGATERMRRIVDAVTRAGLLGPLALPVDRMVAMFKANWRALGAYRPAPIPGDATLIRTEGGFPPEFLDHEPGDSLEDPGLGWTELVQGRLEIRTMPGDHLSILDGDGLPLMARLVGQLVGAATGR